jgi:plastocyanin
MTRKAMPALALSIALAAAGCGGGGGKKSSTAKSTAPRATVAFVSPTKGSTVGSTVTARVTLSNFKLAPQDVGKKPKPGEGHLHFSMDGGKFDHPKYSGANGKLAVKLGVDGKYSPAVTPSITYRHLPVGKHKLEVYLANNDHSNTGVEAETEFTVSGKQSASAAKMVAVTMRNIEFVPKAVSAKVGQTVRWTNADSVDHNVTATKGEGFKSKAFGKGGTFSYKLDKPGKITYVCTLHPGMTGTITVTK